MNLPVNLYSAAQVRVLDRIAIQEYGIPGFELMSRAGGEVFKCLQERWPNARSVAVLCGSGNNGGDGYIIAGLALAAGLNVTVYFLSDPAKLAGDAAIAYKTYRGASEPFQTGMSIEADVLVDAMLGTGLDRAVSGLYAEAVEAVNAHSSPVIAVDIPSGLNADTGNSMGSAVEADCTVSFIGLKQGLFTGQAADYCGEIRFGQLGIPNEIFQRVHAPVTRVEVKAMPRRKRCAHKGHCGHVLVVGGDAGFSGAARMAGEAALRCGAGLVSIATSSVHAGLMNLGRPELMCHGVETTEQLLPLLDKAGIVVIGPGLGQSAWAKTLFDTVLAAGKRMIVDADGLNLLADHPAYRSDWVLTPHPGEAGRLLICSTIDIQQNRYAAVSALQKKFGGVTVLKGAGTLIHDGSRPAVSNTGNPGMASGGMGDVLAGVIAALSAQGLSLSEAARQGVYLHGAAADSAAEAGGERGLLASDLLPYLRRLVN